MRHSRYLLSNQVVGDIKIFVSVVMGMVQEFYKVVMEEERLQQLREDLTELATTKILNGDTYKIVISFFKVETTELNLRLVDKYKQFISIKPESVGVEDIFCLNRASPLLAEYQDREERF